MRKAAARIFHTVAADLAQFDTSAKRAVSAIAIALNRDIDMSLIGHDYTFKIATVLESITAYTLHTVGKHEPAERLRSLESILLYGTYCVRHAADNHHLQYPHFRKTPVGQTTTDFGGATGGVTDTVDDFRSCIG